jgi:hypothetical protein
MNEDEYDPVVFGVATASKVNVAFKYRYDLVDSTWFIQVIQLLIIINMMSFTVQFHSTNSIATIA